MQFIYLGGKYKDNETSVVLVNNTAKTQNFTVPATKRWLLISGRIHNADDVNRTSSCYVLKGTDAIQDLYDSQTLNAATYDFFPRTEQSNEAVGANFPVMFFGGEVVRFYFAAGGASAGGTSKIYLRVLEAVQS